MPKKIPTHPYAATVGAQIAALRKEAELSGAALADLAGLSTQSSVSRVEHDMNTTLEVLQQLADALAKQLEHPVSLTVFSGLPAPEKDRPGRSSSSAKARGATSSTATRRNRRSTP